jgi:hypothetical protein
MKKFFNVKISYERKNLEMSSVKRIVENFLVLCERADGVKDVIEGELVGYDDIAVESISKSNVCNVIKDDDGGKFFKCTLVFIVENDKTKALKKIKEVFIVQTKTIEHAYIVFKDTYVKGSLSECFLRSVSEMNIIDVL